MTIRGRRTLNQVRARLRHKPPSGPLHRRTRTRTGKAWPAEASSRRPAFMNQMKASPTAVNVGALRWNLCLRAPMPLAWSGSWDRYRSSYFVRAGLPPCFTNSPHDVWSARRMKVHEFQAKELLARYGVPVPRGSVTGSAEEAAAIADELGVSVVVKAQIHAGGRGKGGGIKLADSPEQARDVASQILGTRLVTHQTGPEGRLVKRVLVEEQLQVDRELYLGAVIDNSIGLPLVMASADGGVEIEEVAAKTPERIHKTSVDPTIGFQPFQGRQLALEIGLGGEMMRPAGSLIGGLYRCFAESDCSLAEVNPLVVTRHGARREQLPHPHGRPERTSDPHQHLRRYGPGGHHRGGDHPGAPRDRYRGAGRGAAGGHERRGGRAAAGRGGALVVDPGIGPRRGGAKGGGGGRLATSSPVSAGFGRTGCLEPGFWSCSKKIAFKAQFCSWRLRSC